MLTEDAAEPLVLADGTKIDPSTGEVLKERKQRAAFTEVPAPSVAQALVVKSKRSVADLPAPPAQLTGVALVAFYTLFGLGDRDISLALDGKISEEQVRRIRTLDAYKDFMNDAKANIIETSTDLVRDVFQQNAVGAARTVVELAQSNNDVLAFKASQDILDRAGHRPADIIEHRLNMADQLQIVYIERNPDEQAPIIDVPFERLEEDARV